MPKRWLSLSRYVSLLLAALLLLVPTSATLMAQESSGTPSSIMNQPSPSETSSWESLDQQLAEAERLARESAQGLVQLSSELEKKQTELNYWKYLSQESESKLQRFEQYLKEADKSAFDVLSAAIKKVNIWKWSAIASWAVTIIVAALHIAGST